MSGLAEGRRSVPLGRRPRPRPAAPIVALMAVATLCTATAARGGATPGETPSDVWLDAKGKPLPFQTNEEIEQFLQTARVVDRKKIKGGVNPRKAQLVLEQDGTRARAIFRFGDTKQRDVRIGERFYFDFRDSYKHECAAYALSRYLGLDSVPPAVPRQIDQDGGSVQIWVEKALDEDSDKFAPPDIRAWVAQVWDKDPFDNLILNVDRNAGNIKVSRDYHLWLIDHTRAFQPIPELLNPETVVRVRRVFWDQLKSLTDDELRKLVGDYLDGPQMSALEKRRDLLIEHVEGLITERGEGAVLY
jgi:hypothetical protein